MRARANGLDAIGNVLGAVEAGIVRADFDNDDLGNMPFNSP